MPYVTRSPWMAATVSPLVTFNLLLLGEGFNDEATFNSACVEAVYKLLTFSSFMFTFRRPNWLNAFSYFTASVDQGPPAGSGIPGNTAFGSTFDPVTRTITYDSDTVANLIDTLSIQGLNGQPDIPANQIWPRSREVIGQTGSAVVILGPSVAGGASISGEGGYPDIGSTATPTGVFFTGASMDGDYHKVIARAVGHGFGLGDEFELPGAAFLAPTGFDVPLTNWAPNLVVLPTVPTGHPTPTDKWYWEMSGTEQQAAWSIVPHPGAPGTPDNAPHTPVPAGIQLVEGGGGFRTGVYRAFPDCLMRRRLHDATLTIKDPQISFCRVCARWLQIMTAGTTGPLVHKRIEQQDLIFNWVTWANPVSAPTNVTAQTPRGTGPYWTFQVATGAPGGLTVSNLTLENQGGSATAGKDVFQEITFSDLEVTFKGDPSSTPFDVAGALSSATFVQGVDGNGSGQDNNYRHGMKLTLTSDFGGTCQVQVELSVVLKGGRNDIDPGNMVDAVKIYPQIAMTWFRGGTKTVSSFRGCVQVVSNSYRDPAMRSNVASFFSDSNTADHDHRSRAGVIQHITQKWPNWSALFDTYRGNLQTEVELTAVYSAANNPATSRKKDYNWPAGSSTAITLQKEFRQGAHDNIHLHGDMGDDGHANKMLHAPFCAEACMHIHWRWGAYPSSQASDQTERFLGWGWERGNIVSNSTPGAPLIPPSHQLRFAVTQPTATRRAPPNVLGPGAIEVGANALDPLLKRLWYTVDIDAPAVGRRQVIWEHGIGWAYAYHVGAAVIGLLFAYNLSVGTAAPPTIDENFHGLYQDIRYFYFPQGTTQIPPGDTTPNDGSGVTMEQL